MSIKEKAGALLGLTGDRDAQPPTYRAIAPGLTVTDDAAWAWYEVASTNSDLLGQVARDQEQDKADIALGQLAGREWHLKGLWGHVSGSTYLTGLDLDAEGDQGRIPDEDARRVWHAERADDLDHISLPTKKRLLGVKLRERDGANRRKVKSAFGLDDRRIPDAELRQLQAAVQQLGHKLNRTVWKVRIAATEDLAWSIARELHRDTALPVPEQDVISGAPLHRLCSGKVMPMSDHLVFLGADGRPAGVAAVLALTDFPDEVSTPGQEWLAVLNGLETSALSDDLDADGMPRGAMSVLAEESVRGIVPKSRAALKRVDDARKTAKEQRKSAEKGAAGEPDDDITQAEDEARETLQRLKRRETRLVHTHPRIVVSAADRIDLEAKITAVQAAYEDMGITATVCVDEQRELWLETLPGDRVRVPDLGHWQESSAFTASWFWGGAAVGSKDARIPCIGYTTGSTQSLVRFLATESVEYGDAPVIALTGRTRRGKTTAMQLMLLDVMLAPTNYGRMPWAVLIDSKGDAGGIAAAAAEYDVPCNPLRIDENAQAMSGQLDGFLTSDPDHAAETVRDQLRLLLGSGELAQKGSHYVTRAVAFAAEEPKPRAWKAIRALGKIAEGSSDQVARDVYETLRAVTRSGWGRLVAGEEDQRVEMPTDSTLTVLEVPGLFQALPEAEPGTRTSPDDWDDRQRAAVAVLRGLLSWCTTVAAARSLRGRPKVIAVPEVHLLTATQDGRAFLTQQARMGAAAGLSMILDTQDVSGIASMIGLAESISAVFGFAQATESEQRRLASMVGLHEDEDTLSVINNLDTYVSADLAAEGESENLVRRGHCIYRDRRDQAATVQFRLPSQCLIDLLNTSAAAQAARYEDEERRAAERERIHGDEDDEGEVYADAG